MAPALTNVIMIAGRYLITGNPDDVFSLRAFDSDTLDPVTPPPLTGMLLAQAACLKGQAGLAAEQALDDHLASLRSVAEGE